MLTDQELISLNKIVKGDIFVISDSTVAINGNITYCNTITPNKQLLLRTFADKQFDFVYIDSDDVRNLIEIALQLVKPDGIIAGRNWKNSSMKKDIVGYFTQIHSDNNLWWITALKKKRIFKKCNCRHIVSNQPTV